MFAEPLRKALPVVAAHFVLPPGTILSLTLLCAWSSDAVGRNRGSVPLYAALFWNECVAFWYAGGGMR